MTDNDVLVEDAVVVDAVEDDISFLLSLSCRTDNNRDC